MIGQNIAFPVGFCYNLFIKILWKFDLGDLEGFNSGYEQKGVFYED